MKLPTEKQCLQYFKDYKVPENIQQHCINVQKVALFLTEKIKNKGIKIDENFVSSLALMHDLFKVVSIKDLKPNKFHQYEHSPEELEMWKLLRQKYPHMHEGDVAYEVFKEEFPELALSLKNVSNPHREERSWEELIVHYADWRVFSDNIVTLTERLNYLKEMYPRDAGAWEKDELKIIEFEKKIMQQLDFDAEDLEKEIKNGHR